MTICATEIFITFTKVSTISVFTVSILTRSKFLTFVDVELTMITRETGIIAITAVFIELIYALASVTWIPVDLAFVNLAFTGVPGITRLTFT